MPNQRKSDDVFVGRKQELAWLKDAARSTVAQRGRVCLLAGEAGIGKTRLVEELAGFGRAHGMRVLEGRCHEEAGSPPYWPWARALGQLAESLPPRERGALLGQEASIVATAFPEFASSASRARPVNVLMESPESLRFRLFAALSSVLVRLSNQAPVLLILDDLHWADEGTLRLLVFVARELELSHLLLVGTYRNTELHRAKALEATLGELARERVFSLHTLGGLSEGEVQQYCHLTLPRATKPGLARTIHRITDGNPLFLGHVVREMANGNPVTTDGGHGRLPEGLRAAIRGQLRRLSPNCVRLLEMAAILGTECGEKPLASMARGVVEEWMSAVAEATAAHAIEQWQPGHYRFTHPLVREALVQELPLDEKARLHARAASVLEELYGAAAASHASELAEHFGQAEALLGTEKVAEYSLLAGQHALEGYAYERALEHFQKGRALLEGGAMDDRQAAIAVGECNALEGIGRFQEAFPFLREAFDHYKKQTTPQKAVGTVAHAGIWLLNTKSGLQLCEEALALAQEGSLLWGWLRLYWAHARLYLMPCYRSSAEGFQQAVAIARQQGDTSLELCAALCLSYLDWFHVHVGAFRSGLAHALDLVAALESPGLETTVRATLVNLDLREGRIEQAHEHVQVMFRTAGRTGNPECRSDYLISDAFVALAEGNWQRSRESLAPLLKAQRHPQGNCPHVPIIELEYRTGSFAQGQKYLEQLVDECREASTDMPGDAIHAIEYAAWAAYVSGEIAGLGEARSMGQNLVALAVNPLLTALAHLGLGYIALAERDAQAADAHYQKLKDQPLGIFGVGGVFADLPGALARFCGRLDEAVSHLEAARAQFRDMKPTYAWVTCELGETLCERRAPGDHERAAELLAEVGRIARELGMPPLVERSDRALGRIEGARRGIHPAGLTDREVEVLRLIARGRTNKEIAAALFISEKTVHTHLGNVFAKISAGNRTEAAAFALKHEL